MARFEKVQSKTGGIFWYLLLESAEDVLSYMNVDSSLMIQESLSVVSQKSRKGVIIHAHSVIGNIAHSIVDLAEVSAKPLTTLLSEVATKKLTGMLRIIESGDFVCVNSNRGYCDWNSMCKLYEFKRLTVLSASKPFSFPINDSTKPLKVKHLVLENEGPARLDFRFAQFDLQEIDSVGIITSLKEHDPTYILEAVQNADHIYFETQALDAVQNAQMANLFSRVSSKKRIYIRSSWSGMQTIQALKDFDKLSQQHIIKFIND